MRKLRWRVAGRSVAGTAHLETSGACQDCCRWAVVGPYAAAAVADGAGSAEHSALGAEMACTAALETLKAQLAASAPQPAEAVRSAMQAARGRLLDEAVASGADPAAYACTLLVAAAGPQGLFVSHVGDGCCVAVFENGDLQMISEPRNLEFVNVTTFITDSDAQDHIAASSVTTRIKAWAVLTDGLYDLAIDRRRFTPHPGFFRPLLDELAREPSGFSQQLDAWLRSERVAARTDDDVTLFLASCCPR